MAAFPGVAAHPLVLHVISAGAWIGIDVIVAVVAVKLVLNVVLCTPIVVVQILKELRDLAGRGRIGAG